MAKRLSACWPISREREACWQEINKLPDWQRGQRADDSGREREREMEQHQAVISITSKDCLESNSICFHIGHRLTAIPNRDQTWPTCCLSALLRADCLFICLIGTQSVNCWAELNWACLPQRQKYSERVASTLETRKKRSFSVLF